MGVDLIFLFFFQGGLAFAFSFFITSIILKGCREEARAGLIRNIRRIQLVVAAVAVVLTPAMFMAYYESLPEGKPVTLAVWPALWILTILLAIILALSLAVLSRKKA